MRLLLINPKYPESFWSFKWAVEHILPGKRTINPPLGLATLAALCPPHWEIEIVDENVAPVPLAPRADLIGVCGMGVQFPRQRELLGFYRGQGYPVVAGGSYASLCPERYASLADSVVAGEAEYNWPRFCRDWEAGQARGLYRETGTVAMQDSPTPRFDLLQLDKYSTVTLQFSRGCPYRCEFCDIIVMFGRKPRCKAPQQVGRELDELRRRNVRNVFFVDDNLIGNKALAKDLLRYLIDYQRRHQYAFRFGTEASLNLAHDTELLQLFRDANFSWVFIGLESPDPASLKETHKTQNLQEDMLTSIRRIYAYGIDVLAGFIIGFDNDTLDAFDRQYEFITDAGIQAAMIGLLTALPKTPLYQRLAQAGRLIPGADGTDNTQLGTNFLPKQMDYNAMVNEYKALYRRLLADDAIATRIRNKMRYMASPVYQGEYAFAQQLVILAKLLVKGVLPGGVPRLYHFLRSLPWLAPKKFSLVIVDWIAALAMRDYVERHFALKQATTPATMERYLRRAQHKFARYLREGRLALSWGRVDAAPNLPSLTLSLQGWLDKRFFRRAGRQLEKLLKHTSSTVTLRIDALQRNQLPDLDRLLKRLARYGDRISVTVDDKLKFLVAIDSSVFHLILGGSRADGAGASP